jgi:V/A-type H+/Na+-transporting ATPase subunit F
MKDIAVVGNSEFTLGFRLAGIKNIVNTNNPQEELPRFLNNEDVGIVIIDDQTMGKLDEYIKEQVVNSISPVFVVVGKESKQDELRQMIIQSIGVDLMKNDD